MSTRATALRFAIIEILPILDHSEAADAQRPSFEDVFDPEMWKPGAKPNAAGYVESDQIDTSKIAPSVLIVKDDGVYLMSNGKPMLVDLTHGKRSVVAYAKGLDPSAGYGVIRAAVGGDDFSERLQVAAIREAIARAPGATTFVVELSEETISFWAE